jgi:precorrin-6B methylase 2
MSRVRRSIGRLVRRFLPDRPERPTRLPLGLGRGLALEIAPGSPLDIYLGLYEYELTRHLRRLCKPGHRSFDIGGFDGYYALVLARLTGAEVLVFESDPEACRRIERNCARNPAPGSLVRVHNAYVAFETNPDQNCIALDDSLRKDELFTPDLMKLDVDGAEVSALTGAKELLAHRQPHLIVETHSAQLERDCAELLIELGYRPVVVSPRRWLAQNRPIPHNRWLVAAGRDEPPTSAARA